MVMSMNSMGGYGNGFGYSGMNQSGGNNIPARLKAEHGYEFDFRERPQIVSTPIDIVPRVQESKFNDSRFMRFLKMFFN